MTLNRVRDYAQPVRSSGQTLAGRCSPSDDTVSAFFGTRLPGPRSLPTANLSPTATRQCLQRGQARGIESP
jgi:hypothetical protein